MDVHSYVLFAAAVVLLVIVPGPDMAYLLARTVAQGRKAGLLAAIGFNIGGYVHMVFAVTGLSAILAASAAAFTAVKWIGASYLVWLGARAIIGDKSDARGSDDPIQRVKARAILWQAFLSDVLNPKVAMFFLALLPQFVNSEAGDPTRQLVVLGVITNMIAISINVVLVFFAAAATTGLRRNPRLRAWLRRAMGGVLIAVGVRLATDKA